MRDKEKGDGRPSPRSHTENPRFAWRPDYLFLAPFLAGAAFFAAAFFAGAAFFAPPFFAVAIMYASPFL